LCNLARAHRAPLSAGFFSGVSGHQERRPRVFLRRGCRFRHFIGGLLALASLDHACRDHRPGVSATLTTTTFNRSSLRWLEINT